MPHPKPLEAERSALSRILARLMDEEPNLENLCKHTPRIVSVAANVARIQAALEASSEPDETSLLRSALRELDAEQPDEEENTW